jgi:hypothetical protein
MVYSLFISKELLSKNPQHGVANSIERENEFSLPNFALDCG